MVGWTLASASSKSFFVITDARAREREHPGLAGEGLDVRADVALGAERDVVEDLGSLRVVELESVLGEGLAEFLPSLVCRQTALGGGFDPARELAGLVDREGPFFAERLDESLEFDRAVPLGEREHLLHGRSLDRLAARVDLEDLPPPFTPGLADVDEPVEPARAEQGRVDDVGPVGRAHHDHVLEFFEPVHLGQDLVEHGLDHVRPRVRAPRRREGVEFVEEDDRGRDLPGLLEDLAHGPLGLAHPLGEELGPADRG